LDTRRAALNVVKLVRVTSLRNGFISWKIAKTRPKVNGKIARVAHEKLATGAHPSVKHPEPIWHYQIGGGAESQRDSVTKPRVARNELGRLHFDLLAFAAFATHPRSLSVHSQTSKTAISPILSSQVSANAALLSRRLATPTRRASLSRRNAVKAEAKRRRAARESG